MSEPTTTTRRATASKTKAEDVTDYTPEWAMGFDDEDYPDAIMVGDNEKLFFRVLDSNIIPLMDDRTKTLVDTEVVQIELLTGTRVTEKEYDPKTKTARDTGRLVAVGETRSLWINSFMLRKIWQEWDVQNDDEGALVYKGKVSNKSETSEYQKWIGKFNKPNPRKASRQSAS